MQIEYNPQIQRTTRDEIEKHLTPFMWLVPSWVLFVHINLWDCDESGKLASVKVDYAYRTLTIDFTSAWLDRSDDEKTFTVVHELLHGFCGLIADYARDSFNLLCPASEAEKFNKHLQSELCTRHESATQDLAVAVLKMQKDYKKAIEVLERECLEAQSKLED